jgi:hypothetical protein
MPPRKSDDAGLHAWASTGLAIVIAGMVGGGFASRGLGSRSDGPDIDLDEMEAIEASIAYKKAAPEKQPQKKKRAPEPDVKPEGVSHDETKPIEPKKDEPAKKPDETDPDWKKFQRDNQDDENLDVGKPVDDPGVFDPNAPVGWAEETKGDPYFQQLIADLREGWDYPQILQAEGVPVGCMRIEKDGSVSDTKFEKQSGNSELDDSVERALKALEKKRKNNPPPVPEHLLKHTTRWICFKFEV